MSEAVRKLMPTLEALSLKDKEYIVQHILDLLEEDDEEAAFIAELNRRIDDYLSDKDPGIPAEEVHGQLLEKFG